MSGDRAMHPAAGALDALTVLRDPVDLLSYRRDCSVVTPGRPELAVQARNAREVAAVVAQAAANRQPLYVRGGGTMYAGGANPHAGGVVVDLSRMTEVLELDLARGIVVVAAGIKFTALLEYLKPHGQTIGIVPSTGPAATVGGACSAHALGTGSPRHQSLGDCVAGLEVVLADGSLVRTGSAACQGAGFFQRYCMGPDLTGLFLGADGAFGIITAVALWLYPAPAVRETFCLGFPDALHGANFLSAMQAAELTRDLWYAAGYEAAAVRARVLAAQPATDPTSVPGFCLGFEVGGATQRELSATRARFYALAANHGGRDYAAYDEVYFRRLRHDETYWYAFAGYFARSRCAILMTSLPCDRLPAFLAVVDEARRHSPHFTWGAAVVACRRGLHGGVLAFYDERTEWESMQSATQTVADALWVAGCVPYKSGKLWAAQLRASGGYFALLERVKRGLDPSGMLGPGNLGLSIQSSPAR